jgi:hypothetical protein
MQAGPKEHLSSLLNQEDNTSAGVSSISIGARVRSAEMGNANAAARASINDFFDDIEATAYTAETTNNESTSSRLGRKVVEVVLPISAGMGAKAGAEAAVEAASAFSGPLVGAAVAGITGITTGAVSAAVEMHGVKKDGTGAAEFYKNKILQREFEKEEIKNSSGIGKVARNAWMAIKVYSSGAKNVALETGFGVKNRNKEINVMLADRGIDINLPIYEQLAGLDVPTLELLTQKLYVQSMLSGFAEQKTSEEIAKRVDLLVCANADLYRRYNGADPAQITAKIFEKSQAEVEKIIGRTRMVYIMTGAIDRGAKSAMYALVGGYALNSLKRMFEHKDVVSGAGSVAEMPQAHALNDELARTADHQEVLENMHDKAQADVSRARDVWESARDGGGHIDVTDKAHSVFGEGADRYLDGGGVGPGSRLDRLEVLANFNQELTANPELKTVVGDLARGMGISQEEFVGAFILRAQYAEGAVPGNIAKLLGEMKAGDFSHIGSIWQGHGALESLDPRWKEMFGWALENGGTDPDAALRNYENAQSLLRTIEGAQETLERQKIEIIEDYLRAATVANTLAPEMLAGLNQYMDLVSTMFGAAAASLATAEVFVRDQADVANRLRNLPPRNRNTNGGGAGNGGGGLGPAGNGPIPVAGIAPAPGAGSFGGSGGNGNGGGGWRVVPPSSGGLGGPTPTNPTSGGGGQNPGSYPRNEAYDMNNDTSTETDWRQFASRSGLVHGGGPIINLYKMFKVDDDAPINLIKDKYIELGEKQKAIINDPTTAPAQKIAAHGVLKELTDGAQILVRARKAYQAEFLASNPTGYKHPWNNP